jgi:hypothetical protein
LRWGELMKKKLIGIGIAIIIIFVAGIIFLYSGKKPLKNLNASDITSIEVSALPPNEVKYIGKQEDIESIVSELRKVVVYSKVNQNDYNGQIITYTLVMKDGSKRQIMISNPIVRIDAVYYKAKYAPADDLHNLYSKLNYKAVKK